jgi:hypothetical protein
MIIQGMATSIVMNMKRSSIPIEGQFSSRPVQINTMVVHTERHFKTKLCKEADKAEDTRYGAHNIVKANEEGSVICNRGTT